MKLQKEIFFKKVNFNIDSPPYKVKSAFGLFWNLQNRKLLEKIGYFDCFSFKDYFADVDFSFRAKALEF